MTLDTAIRHAKEAADQNRQRAIEFLRVRKWGAAAGCKANAKDSEQLALWLIELKHFKEKNAEWIDRGGIFECSNCSSESGVMTRYCSDCGYQMDGGAENAADCS